MSCASSTEKEVVKTSGFELSDTTISFMWRGPKYDEELGDTFSSILLNEDYLANISEQERAAIGYVATFIGNECWWDGEANENYSNLDCTIISALGLGYQCSDKHLGFLRKWFETDSLVLTELEESNCPTIPYTATSQNTFNEITITTKGNSIHIYFEAGGVNLRAQESWEWSETVHFTCDADHVELIKKDKSPVEYESFEMME